MPSSFVVETETEPEETVEEVVVEFVLAASPVLDKPTVLVSLPEDDLNEEQEITFSPTSPENALEHVSSVSVEEPKNDPIEVESEPEVEANDA